MASEIFLPFHLHRQIPSHPSAMHPAYTRYGLRFVPRAQVSTLPTFPLSSANVLPDDGTTLLGPRITGFRFHAPPPTTQTSSPLGTPCLPGPRCLSSTELSPPGLSWEKADLFTRLLLLSVTWLWSNPPLSVTWRRSEKDRFFYTVFPLFP